MNIIYSVCFIKKVADLRRGSELTSPPGNPGSATAKCIISSETSPLHNACSSWTQSMVYSPVLYLYNFTTKKILRRTTQNYCGKLLHLFAHYTKQIVISLPFHFKTISIHNHGNLCKLILCIITWNWFGITYSPPGIDRALYGTK